MYICIIYRSCVHIAYICSVYLVLNTWQSDSEKMFDNRSTQLYSLQDSVYFLLLRDNSYSSANVLKESHVCYDTSDYIHPKQQPDKICY